MYSEEETKHFLKTQVARPASAGVVVCNHAGEALVLKAHYKPYWSFPGGWIEEGQTPLLAAARELEEETGIHLPREQFEFLFVINRVSDILQSYQFMFRAIDAIDDMTLITLQPEEIADYKFVSKQAVLANINKYGGAVQLWARGKASGYYEQIVTI